MRLLSVAPPHAGPLLLSGERNVASETCALHILGTTGPDWGRVRPEPYTWTCDS